MADDKLKLRAREAVTKALSKFFAGNTLKGYVDGIAPDVAAFAAELVAEARVEEARKFEEEFLDQGGYELVNRRNWIEHLAKRERELAALRTPQPEGGR